MSEQQQKWINLNDRVSGAKLKMDVIDGEMYVFITGLSKNHPRWGQAIKSLGFEPSPSQKFLLKLVRSDEKLLIRPFQSIWPSARLEDMPVSSVRLNLRSRAVSAARGEDERDVALELANARLLGVNADGDAVYMNGAGRFIYRPGRGIANEDRALKGSLFLRADTEEALAECADGVVMNMLQGGVLKREDLVRFVFALNGREEAEQSVDDHELAHEVIDAAASRHLTRQFQTANDAYGDAVLMYERMPSYQGALRGRGAMPLPLSLLAQRLLGDTKGKTVVYPNAYDGAAFSHLPAGTQIKAFSGGRDLSAQVRAMRDDVTWGDAFHHARNANADALFFNADPVRAADGTRQDFKDASLALRSLQPGGRAVLVLASDLDTDGPDPDARRFYDSVFARYAVDEAFEVGGELATTVGTRARLRVVALRNVPPAMKEGVAPVSPTSWDIAHSWDEVKARVDESLARQAIVEAESDGVNVGAARENLLQKPYIAFSRVGEARTMVPKELQSALHALLTDIESQYGPVDEFVERELQLGGEHSLGAMLSPEQVDGVAIGLARMKRSRGVIIGDETGIGKGRTIASLVSWALKQGRPVVFLTDRSNLFSDLARDLRDIGEWGRVRPLVMNADGVIVDTIGDAGVLAEATPPAEMRRLLDGNIGFNEGGFNVIFATYSQISKEDSEKALWLKNLINDALLVTDEAHVASGSDSNTAVQVAELTQAAWNVIYSSATWAKTQKNLHIYARAFPPSVNVATLAETMARGGEAFSEVFSSMLAREGAFFRREHDLSRLEFVVEVDAQNQARNVEVSDQVARIMSSLAFMSGAIKRVVSRVSDLNVTALREARDARGEMQKTSIFTTRFGTGNMLYQVMRRLNAVLNVDNAVDLALKGIEAGRKPVIVFDDTGESFIKAALQAQAQDGEALPDVVRSPTIRDLLRRMVDGLNAVRVETVDIDDLPDLINEVEDGEPADLAAEGAAGDEVPAAVLGEAQVEGQQGAPAAAAARAAEADAEGVALGEVMQALDPAAATAAQLQAAAGAEGAAPSKKSKKKKRPVKIVPFTELESIPEESREQFARGLEEVNRLIEALPALGISVPDEIASRLAQRGLRVAELSGRSFRLEPVAPPEQLQQGGDGVFEPVQTSSESTQGLFRVVPRVKSKAAVNTAVRGFNSGEIDAMVINRSAATGLSLHASPRFQDRRRRQLIEMQIPENPTDRLQLYGRVNRFDQESFPLIQVASTGIFGEVRQIMVQNKKLQLLSANVRSSRDSHAVVSKVPDLLNSIGRDVCKSYLRDNPEILLRLDINPDGIDEEGSAGRDYASLVTSRIPLLEHKSQATAYEQLYALFDDALIQAELSGENPLKPRELDVRAKIVDRRIMFGFDHGGLGSAFDGAVFVEAIQWEERVNPMSMEAILAVVRASRERLLKDGLATRLVEESDDDAPVNSDADPIPGQVPPELEGSIPKITISALAQKAATQMEARARLSVANTTFESAEAALLAPTANSVQTTMGKAHWLRRNLDKMIPGRLVELPFEKFAGANSWTRTALILDVQPPKPGRESQLAQWRVTTLAIGESKPVVTTLASLMRSVTLRLVPTREQADEAEHGAQLLRAGKAYKSPYLEVRFAEDGPVAAFEGRGRVRFGSDFVDVNDRLCTLQGKALEKAIFGRDRVPGAWFWDDVKRYHRPRVRNRHALMLTGNMYLASEWAAKTKAGSGVVFSDEAGMRHRAIQLSSKISSKLLFRMPTRMWVRPMLDSFVDRVLDEIDSGEMRPEELGGVRGIVAYTSFSGAMTAVTSNASQGAKLKDRMIIVPGQGIRIHVGKEGSRRVVATLRQAQINIVKAEQAAKEARERLSGAAAPGANEAAQQAEQGAQPAGGVEAPTAEQGAADPAAAQAQARPVRGRKKPAKAVVDPDHVSIGKPGGKRRKGEDKDSPKASEWIQLTATSRAQMHRAIEMLVKGPGLEVYVPHPGRFSDSASLRVAEVAQQCVRDYFIDRLREEAAADPRRREAVEGFIADLERSSDADAEQQAMDEVQRLLDSFAEDELDGRERRQTDLFTGEDIGAGADIEEVQPDPEDVDESGGEAPDVDEAPRQRLAA